MWRLLKPFATLALAAVLVTAPVATINALSASPAAADSVAIRYTSPAIGAWVGDVHGAQYEPHLYLFHADGTMEGTNPQRVQERADGTGVNDSVAFGVWHMERGRVVGKFLELNANQVTHKPAPTLTVVFSLSVSRDRITGTAQVFVGAERVPDASFDLHRITA